MSILIYPFKPKIDHGAREQLLRQKPRLLWFTGLSGSGKSTLAVQLEFELWELGYKTYLLDGDNVRAGLSKDLDFTDAGRIENIRRIGEVAKLFLDAGIIVLSAFISPFRSEREIVRNLAGEENFLEIFVDTPLETCEERDVKGLYKKARQGQIPNFTGINSPYESPENPFLRIPTHLMTMENSIATLKSNILPLIEI
jgi:adenylyl-sulfate kinase